MNQSVSANTQVILLLTARLIASQNGTTNGELLTHGEYRRLARYLRDLGHEPADLLGNKSTELLWELRNAVPGDRISRLLERGFLMSQAVERWQSRAIWVISRADPAYPRKIKRRLKEDSPAVLYGCGDPKLLESGGLAIVGSRHVDQVLLDYAGSIGRQCALAKKSVVSGGAQGIDRAAMGGALESGGRVTGVLADSLERAALSRDHRNWLLEEQLALVSPYDPSAGFNVGHAMQRNKLIYALADAGLVVNAEHEKGGTWAGATEQLQKLRFVPVYVRSTGDMGNGLGALVEMGASPWPNPQSSDDLSRVFDLAPTDQKLPSRSSLALADAKIGEAAKMDEATESTEAASVGISTAAGALAENSVLHATQNYDDRTVTNDETQRRDHFESLIACVRKIFLDLLSTPKTEKEIGIALQISQSQTNCGFRDLLRKG